MNSGVFWSGVIGLVDSLAPFCDLCNSTLSTRRRFAARKLIQSFFSTRGKFPSSPQLGKCFFAKYPTHVAGYEHFLTPCSKTPSFGERYCLVLVIIRSTQGLGPRSNFSLSARGGSVNYTECAVRFHGKIVIIWGL